MNGKQTLPEVIGDTARQWLHFTSWPDYRRWREPQRGRLICAGSAQFARRGVAPGDTLWIVSAQPAEQLILCGRLVVARLTRDIHEVERRVGSNRVWRGRGGPYALARAGSEELLAETLSIAALARELRFVGAHERLDVSRPLGPQLRALRLLTPATAGLLDITWSYHLATPSPVSRPGLAQTLLSERILGKPTLPVSRRSAG